MTFPTDAATITVRKSFGICGPAIISPLEAGCSSRPFDSYPPGHSRRVLPRIPANSTFDIIIRATVIPIRLLAHFRPLTPEFIEEFLHRNATLAMARMHAWDDAALALMTRRLNNA